MKFLLPLLFTAAISVQASAETVCGKVHTIKMEGRNLFSVVMTKADGTDQGIGIDVSNISINKKNLPVDLALLDLAKVAIASPAVELCLDTSEAQKSFIRRVQ